MPLTYQHFRNDSQLQNAANNSPALTWGARGTGVAEAQRALVALGFSMPNSTRPNGVMDGFYGDETFSAVWDFQDQKKIFAKRTLNLNLAVDGVAGKDTLATLDRIMNDRAVQPSEPPEFGPVSIQVVGSAAFVGKIFEAMQLLQSRAPGAYKILVDHVEIIRSATPTGMDAANRHPTMNIAPPTFQTSLTWVASVLAHESYHSLLYQGGMVWTGTEAERKCNRHQLVVLQKIGAPANEISHLRGQDGQHHDLNRDGVYDNRDYLLRNY